jgi:WD40 repeat protein
MSLPNSLRAVGVALFALASFPTVGRAEIQADPIEPRNDVTAEAVLKIQIEGAGEIIYADANGPFAMFGGGKFPQKGSRSLYSLTDGKLLGTIPEAASGKLGKLCALAPSGKYFASASVFDTVHVFGPECAPLPDIKAARGLKDVRFLADDRLALVGKDSIEVWNLAAGKSESAIPLLESGPFAPKPVLSPNGKIIVVASKNALVLQDAAGKKLGGFPLPASTAMGGAAFHPNGKTLAVLLTSVRKGALVQVDITTGKFGPLREIPDTLPTRFEGRPIEWSANGEALMVLERFVVDPASGRAIWEFPGYKKGVGALAGTQPTPKLFGITHGVYLSDAGKGQILKGIVHDDDKIAAMKKSVQSGASVSAAAFPKLTDSTLKGVASAATPKAPAPWTVKLEPFELTELPKQKIPLDIKPGVVGEIFFTPASGRVFVESLTEPQSAGATKAKSVQTKAIDILNVTEGLRAGSVEVPFAARLRAASPDGRWLALTDAESDTRVDVLSTEGGKHLVGFKPFSQDINSPQIKLVRFVGDNKLLTDNGARIVIWSIPDCKAVVQLQGAAHTAVLSPNGKLIALALNTGVRLIDAVTLKTLGDLPAPKADANCQIHFKALAFDPKGQALAALCEMTRSDSLTWAVVSSWDLATGKSVYDFTVPGQLFSPHARASVEFVGNEHFLVNHTYLLGANRDEVMWTFETGGATTRHATGSPDGRHWFVTAPTLREAVMAKDRAAQDVAVLVSTDLLKTSILNWVKKVDAAPKVLWKAGGDLSLEVALGGEMKEQVKNVLVKSFTRQGTKIVDGAAARLKLSESERQIGESTVRDLDKQRPMPPIRKGGSTTPPAKGGSIPSPFNGNSTPLPTVAINEKDVVAELTINGKLLWNARGEFSNRRMGLMLLQKGETVEAHLAKELSAAAAHWAITVNPPKLIVEAADGIVMALPGKARYTTQGLVVYTPVLNPKPAK